MVRKSGGTTLPELIQQCLPGGGFIAWVDDFALGLDTGFEALVEFGVLFGAKEHFGQRLGVADGEVARVVGPEKAD